MFPIEPTNDAMPKPIPLRGKGNICVINKKKTEKYAHIQNLAKNTKLMDRMDKKQD
jgi:hypothetical protein